MGDHPGARLAAGRPYFAILPALIPGWFGVFAACALYRVRLQGFFDEAPRATSAVSVGKDDTIGGVVLLPAVLLLASCRFCMRGARMVALRWC